MTIDKKELLNDYITGNMTAFFNKASEITGFILNRKYFSIASNPEEKEDVTQDCMISLWEKMMANKVDPNKGDLMSFIWKNSNFKIMDYLKKKKRRERIAYFFSYEEFITETVLKKEEEGEEE